jgi:Mg2+ and Co2+ transporter CorA
MSARDYSLPQVIGGREIVASNTRTRKIINIVEVSNASRRYPIIQQLTGRVQELEDDVAGSERKAQELRAELELTYQVMEIMRREAVKKIRVITYCYSGTLLFTLMLWAAMRWVG